MSKHISFPILEITTLAVVLFACILVIVPGFDEFTTSMLFSNSQPVAEETLTVAENHALPLQDELSPSSQVVRSDSLQKFDSEYDSVDDSDDSLSLEPLPSQADSDSLQLVPDNQLVINDLAPIQADEFSDLADNDPGDSDLEIHELEAQSDTQDEPVEFLPETDYIEPLEAPAPDRFEEMLVENQQQPEQNDNAAPTIPELADQVADPTVDMQLSTPDFSRSSAEDLFAAAGNGEERLHMEDLPRVVYQRGNQRRIQQAPTIIRMPSVFPEDMRVVVNPLFSQSIQPINADVKPQDASMMIPGEVQALTSKVIDEARPTESRPYQVRTTARPHSVDDNYFVPQR